MASLIDSHITRTPHENEVNNLTQRGVKSLQHGNILEAIKNFKQAYLLSLKLYDATIQRSCTFNLGAALLANGYAEKAIKYLQKSFPPKNLRDGPSNGDIYYNLSLAYELIDNNEESTHCLLSAYKEYQLETLESNASSNKLVGEIAQRLAQKYLKIGQYENAMNFAHTAVHNLLQSGSNTADLIRSKLLLVDILLNINKKEEAMNTIDDCSELCDQINNGHLRSKVVSDIGLMNMKLSRPKEAFHQFYQALTLIQKSSLKKSNGKVNQANRTDEALLLQNIGVVKNELGEFDDAQSYHREAVKLHRANNNVIEEGHCQFHLGYTLSQLGIHNEAQQAYLRACQLAVSVDDSAFHCQSLEALAGEETQLGHYTEAILYLKQAIALSQQDSVLTERIVNKLESTLALKQAEEEANKKTVTSSAYSTSVNGDDEKDPNLHLTLGNDDNNSATLEDMQSREEISSRLKKVLEQSEKSSRSASSSDLDDSGPIHPGLLDARNRLEELAKQHERSQLTTPYSERMNEEADEEDGDDNQHQNGNTKRPTSTDHGVESLEEAEQPKDNKRSRTCTLL